MTILYPPIYSTSRGIPRDLGSLINLSSQGFGENVEYYKIHLGMQNGHDGVDWSCVVGTPIYASHDGKVKSVSLDPAKGEGLRIECPEGATLYWHLSRVDVVVGQEVKVGQAIGLSGNTGFSTGPHLHFGWFKNGKAVNPTPLLQWRSLSASDENMTKTVVDLLYEILDIGDADGSGRAYWVGKPIEAFLKVHAKDKGNKLLTLSQ